MRFIRWEHGMGWVTRRFSISKSDAHHAEVPVSNQQALVQPLVRVQRQFLKPGMAAVIIHVQVISSSANHQANTPPANERVFAGQALTDVGGKNGLNGRNRPFTDGSRPIPFCASGPARESGLWLLLFGQHFLISKHPCLFNALH
jgi:hypothetical protein